MPEGDTVWLTAHRLDLALAGRALTAFDLRVPQLALADLRGERVSEVVSRGKHLLVRTEGGHTLHSHLRMDGSWRIVRPAEARRLLAAFDVRAVLGNDEWLAVGSRIHDLAIAPTGEEDRWVGHLGPDLLGPDWDPSLAAARAAEHPDRPVAEVLLDQRTLAGVGNMYAAEVLFVHRTRPHTPIAKVADLDGLMRTCFRLLRANRDHPEQSTTGSLARGEQHWVYRRQGQPCRRCRTPIVSGQIGQAPQQRTTFWCPQCQPAAG